MNKQERLAIVPYLDNGTWLIDEVSLQFWCEGRFSQSGTLEDNMELNNTLKAVYEDYLSTIASRNNGNY
ncbi:hypothetical protein [Caproiciproducens sp.]|uniref:hypothetical protein n=1 Tax=Caproiciproducens sp. TaxID=1954376 RepID=UPI00289EFBF7|nr:hypothetical protein [Caproiciproducens sp.]